MSSVPKYVLGLEGEAIATRYATVGVFGPILANKYTSQLSAVVTVFAYISRAFRFGERTIACIESGEFELAEVVDIMATHKHVFGSTLWTLDAPSRQFLRAQCDLRTRPILDDALDDDTVRFALASLRHELTRTLIVPSTKDRPHPEVAAAVTSDLRAYTSTRLDSISIRLLALAFANVASKKRTQAEPLVEYTAPNGRRLFCRAEDWPMICEQQQAVTKAHYEHAAEYRRQQAYAEARQFGAYLRQTGQIPKDSD